MPTSVYSTRFLNGRSGGTTQTLIVPTGKRAVVRFVSIITFVGTTDFVVVKAAGQAIVWLNTPTPQVTKHYDVRCVVYAGEAIEIVTDGGDVAWHVSGFLFGDT